MSGSVSSKSDYIIPVANPIVVRLHELAIRISFFQNAILPLPRSHPLRAPCVQALATALLGRYSISNNSEDLERSIPHFTEAIFLPLPWDRHCLNIIELFFSLTLALVLRADESRQPKDVTRSIIYLRNLRGQSLEAFNVPPNRVTELLVDALRIQVEMKIGDMRQDIEEMAVLCRKLLKSDMSTTSVTNFMMCLIRAIQVQIESSEREEPSDKVIECLREAKNCLPGSHEISRDVSITLAWSLCDRFSITYSDDDYEEGMAILDKVIRDPGDRVKLREAALGVVKMFTAHRSYFFGSPESLHSELALYRRTTPLGDDEASALHPAKYVLIPRRRFDDSNDLQEAQLRNSGLFVDRPSFRDQITNGAEIEDAVKHVRLLLAPNRHGGALPYLACLTLGRFLFHAFSCTRKIEYLNEMISVFRDNFNSRGERLANFAVIRGLIECLTIRFVLFSCREDFNEIMNLYPIAVNDERARTPDRFMLSSDWAFAARMNGHPSTPAAYDSAMSLMQDTLTFCPTLDIQHSQLVAIRDSYESLSLDYASYHVSTGQLPRAIEILERGRALIWSEMRGLRTSIDQNRAIDSDLADKFAAVNRDLEKLTFAISANSNDDGPGGGFVRMDSFGLGVVQQRKLLDDRNKLISQIQALPGLETFLKPTSFDNLYSASTRGPVIIVNHSRWRSDILILVQNSPPSFIPTADDFYDRAKNLRDQLFGGLKEGPDSIQYENALRFVLKELYELVGRPVIQRLNELSVPEQSRIWWCPTSVFCSLPLHAMGPIPPYNGRPRYFLDLYIPSYTPALSTLIESNRTGSGTSDKPSILLVLQPDALLRGAFGEMQVVQATSTNVTTLISAMATPTTVLERLRDHRFAHIVCHGILEQGKPFDASFKLYKGRRLSLLDIVRSRLPDAEFAFLAACHTAELTEGSIADEVLHLTAAVQYCGFRSVVGTMWAMADIDGRDLAENFYKRVFSSKKQEVRYYERTAKALRDSVKNLRRKKGMTLERWVNFVHYGA